MGAGERQRKVGTAVEAMTICFWRPDSRDDVWTCRGDSC